MQTDPVGGPAGQPQYLNAAIRLTSTLSAQAMHERLIEIETELGRERHVRWGSRKIDLDLLLFGGQSIQTETLTVPHPRMSFRRFVLEPCLDIAGEMVHVTSGKSISQLLEHLNSRANVIAWVNPNVKLLQELSLDDALAGWTLVPVNDLEQLTAFEALAKFVVVEQHENCQELVKRALAFPGPMLDLTQLEGISDEEIAAEVRAAAVACS